MSESANAAMRRQSVGAEKATTKVPLKIAEVMLRKPGLWSPKQVAVICAWLRRCADRLEKEHLQYTHRGHFRFRRFSDGRQDHG